MEVISLELVLADLDQVWEQMMLHCGNRFLSFFKKK
jgi:hypothetical protein